MSSTANLRSQMQPVGRGVRAYFAPVDRTNGTPTMFDPAQAFDPDAPASPWIDLGWVERFQRKAATTVSIVRAGESAGVAAQYRSGLDAQVECEFHEWGKLQMALAGGGMHFNVLANGSAALLARSSKTQLLLNAPELANFAPGDLVAVDVDYGGETGFVGTGIAAAYADGSAREAGFVRRVTFNVARVAGKTDSALVLAGALPGGDPAVNASVQKVVGFVDREGGSFFQEWSALFVMPEDSGGRISFFYPRLQVMSGASEGENEISAPIVGRTLKASFRALPIADPVDGEMAVCWRSYFPASAAAV